MTGRGGLRSHRPAPLPCNSSPSYSLPSQAHGVAARPHLLAGKRYDELVTGQKSIRYHWQGILSVIRALPGGLGERVESARRQLEESGATVNLLDDRGAPRWTFDPLPFVISPDEWSELEAGLIQRARLLDAVLADLYGPQTLLAERLVPPMLVHANRHFLRACRVTDAKPPAAISASTPSTWCGWAAANGTCWPTTPRCRRAWAMRSRSAACWRAACPRPSARSRCAMSGRSSTAGTIRCSPWRRRRAQPQHGRADAGLAVGDLFRACLSLARARRAAGRGRRPGGARRRGADQDAGRPAPRAHAAAPARQRLRRSARAARRFGAGRHRPGRGDAQRQDRARQRAGLGRGRDAGADAVPRTAERASARPAAAACRRSTCGGWASRRPMPSRWPIST